MKIVQEDIVTFKPITVTFESKEEVRAIINLCHNFSGAGSLNWLENKIMKEFIERMESFR